VDVGLSTITSRRSICVLSCGCRMSGGDERVQALQFHSRDLICSLVTFHRNVLLSFRSTDRDTSTVDFGSLILISTHYKCRNIDWQLMLEPLQHLDIQWLRLSDPRRQLCMVFVCITRIGMDKDTAVGVDVSRTYWPSRCNSRARATMNYKP
jgi:hypothetical protein